YDRALVELAALLQRIAIVQIVPDAAPQDEDYDAETLARLAQTLAPEDVQLYYQIALGGRRDLAMAPEPRAGFEMTLLRMLAFRPDAATATAAATAPAAGRSAGATAPRAGASSAASADRPAAISRTSAAANPPEIPAQPGRIARSADPAGSPGSTAPSSIEA